NIYSKINKYKDDLFAHEYDVEQELLFDSTVSITKKKDQTEEIYRYINDNVSILLLNDKNYYKNDNLSKFYAKTYCMRHKSYFRKSCLIVINSVIFTRFNSSKSENKKQLFFGSFLLIHELTRILSSFNRKICVRKRRPDGDTVYYNTVKSKYTIPIHQYFCSYAFGRDPFGIPRYYDAGYGIQHMMYR
ncbi:unnamed protein product, partial [Didymodactylos carnosus]